MASVFLTIFSFLAVYPYFIYPLIIAIIYVVTFLRKNKDDNHVIISEFPKVSVLLSVYNEEGVVEDKIKNIFSLDYPQDKLELLVGSDGSSDNTNKIIHLFNDKRLHLFEFNDRRGKQQVLKDLFREAEGEIILITDANTIFDTKALLYIMPNFQDKHIGGVCGRLVLKKKDFQSNEYLQFYWTLENKLKSLESNVCSIMAVNGQIFALRKQLFQFGEEGLATEDQVLGMKIIENDYRLIFESRALAFEEIGDIWSEFERRIRISSGNFQSFFILKKLISFKKGFRSFCFWSHKVLRNLTPVFLFGFLISNSFLLQNNFLKILFIVQIIFYILTALCFLFKNLYHFTGPLKFFLSFAIMQLAIIFGFFRFIRREKLSIWEKQR
ncbi:MAG: glycosyltransferase [Candidatus Omnitrophica bacterium]|nr:glycosyltransferase [Candidatus Omnitrophota bacterium]